MRRFWVLLGALVVADVLAATALAFVMPYPASREQPSPQQPDLRPFFTFSSDPARLENRIRNVVRREMQQLGPPGRTPGPVSPVEALSQRERNVAPGPQARERATGDQAGPRVRRERQTTALLTPFGMYQAGPTGVGLALLSLCTLLVVGGGTLYLLPQRLRVLRDTVSESWREVLHLGAVGLLGYLVSFLLLFILVTLVVGLPFAALLLLVLAATTFLGLVTVSLALGRWLKSRLALPVLSPLADLSLGMLLLFPLGLVPLVGWALILMGASVGLGAILLTKIGSATGWSLAPLLGEDNAQLP